MISITKLLKHSLSKLHKAMGCSQPCPPPAPDCTPLTLNYIKDPVIGFTGDVLTKIPGGTKWSTPGAVATPAQFNQLNHLITQVQSLSITIASQNSKIASLTARIQALESGGPPA